MADVKWTDQQWDAISDRDGALLVSAAAGSGKTAVLVERLLRRIEEEHESLSRFLMITYTKAAASELRTKIGKALSKRIANDPTNHRLIREFNGLHNAKIQTVHAFCSSLLRTHGYLLGLPGEFRIVDETEADLMCRTILDDLMEEWYAELPDWFVAASEALSNGRGDAPLITAILSLFQKSRSHPFPEAWLASLNKPLIGQDLFATEWGAYLRTDLKEQLSYLTSELEDLIQFLQLRIPGLVPSALESDLELYSAFSDALDVSWDACFELSQTKFATFSWKKSADPELKDSAYARRTACKKIFTDLCGKLMIAPSNEIMTDHDSTLPVIDGLVQAVLRLSDVFSKEKIRRGAFDYSDLEHFAISLLAERTESHITPTPLARSISEEFCEIMVDEYQDSNAVQDLIFRMISKDERNIVMVGDLKQSIYRFRLADPGIFLEKYKRFAPKAQAKPGEPRKVLLNTNFRSRGEVLDSVNHYFTHLMTEQIGDIDYTDAEALHLRPNPFPNGGDPYKTEVLAVDLCCAESEDELAPDKVVLEARTVAHKIRDMVKNGFQVTDGDTTRPAQYRDFVILMRAVSTRGEVFRRTLNEEGVPCVSEKKSNLLGSVEVGILISLLTVIDNPLQDVPLASVLRSPLFGFTADELSALRLYDRHACYYDVLLAAAKEEGPLAEKTRGFLSKLRELRDLSYEFSGARMIWEAIQRTHAFGLIGAMPEGTRRVQNLILFYQYAMNFGGSLFELLEHLAHLAETGKDIPGYAEESGDSVQIMSIHKSKGLEFPIVILSGCHREFNRMDLNGAVLIDPDLGLGLKVRDPRLKAEWPTLARIAIQTKAEAEMKSEEMRLLYVAMTRPVDKLILTLAVPDLAKQRSGFVGMSSFHPAILRKGNLVTPWTLYPALMEDAPLVYTELEAPAKGKSMASEVANSKDLTIDFASRFAFTYPHLDAIDQPSKATATGLSESDFFFEPAFDLPETFRDPDSLTPTERGIAIHLAMQLVEFEKCTTLEGCTSEVLRLKQAGYFSDAEFDAIDPNRIHAFFRSDLGMRVLSSLGYARESRFSVLVPAPNLPEESVLLQGVIDLYFEESDGLVVVDFKSDRTSHGGKEKYAPQLEAYANALCELTGKPVKERCLFFLTTGETVVCE
ncbi:MAG: helicase-exonuclease AddAB subunit AddA [Oscillospiraceae bacterium]|nr:helicase-exonuclease AddAB subunit AddA [Oscillospiraceae bacterium]